MSILYHSLKCHLFMAIFITTDANINSARIHGNFSSYAEYYDGVEAGTYDFIVKLIRQHSKLSLKQDIDSGDSKFEGERSGHILDIGSGPAITIDMLNKQFYFDQLTLIEPNPYFQKQWLNKPWFISQESDYSNSHSKILHIYPTTVETAFFETNMVDMEHESIDVLICTHSIYHYNIDLLESIIENMGKLLKPNKEGIGIITIVSDNDTSIAYYRQNMVPNYQLSTKIETILKEKQIEYEIHLQREYYQMTKQDCLTFLMWDIEQTFLLENYFTRSEIDSQDLKSKFRNERDNYFKLYIESQAFCNDNECESENTTYYRSQYLLEHYIFYN